MGKRILIFVYLFAGAAQVVFAKTGVPNSDSTKSNKKYSLSIGILLASVTDFSVNTLGAGYGGNLKFNYLLSSKLGLGIKIMSAGDERTSTTSFPYSIDPEINTNGPASYLQTDITATYYILGNYNKSKAGLYTEVGIGYQHLYNTYSFYSAGAPSIPAYGYTLAFINNGFGGHFSVGGSHKLGKGKIYLEAVFAATLIGTDNYKYSNAIYPGSVYPSELDSFSEKSGLIGNNPDGISMSGITLGYCFNF